MSQLNKNQRLIAIGMLEAGLRHVDIAEHLGVSCGTITHLVACYRVFGTVDDLPCSGRPRVTMLLQDHHIQMPHLRDHFLRAMSSVMVTPDHKNN